MAIWLDVQQASPFVTFTNINLFVGWVPASQQNYLVDQY